MTCDLVHCKWPWIKKMQRWKVIKLHWNVAIAQEDSREYDHHLTIVRSPPCSVPLEPRDDQGRVSTSTLHHLRMAGDVFLIAIWCPTAKPLDVQFSVARLRDAISQAKSQQSGRQLSTQLQSSDRLLHFSIQGGISTYGGYSQHNCRQQQQNLAIIYHNLTLIVLWSTEQSLCCERAPLFIGGAVDLLPFYSHSPIVQCRAQIALERAHELRGLVLHSWRGSHSTPV